MKASRGGFITERQDSMESNHDAQRTSQESQEWTTGERLIILIVGSIALALVIAYFVSVALSR